MSETFVKKVRLISLGRTGIGKNPHRKPVVSEKQVSYNIDMVKSFYFGGIYDYLTQKEETIEYGIKKCSTGNRQRCTI